jgi:glycosyltransferase involved in cell wall biosynthesis
MRNKKVLFVADAKSIHTVKWVDYFVDRDYDVYLATFSSENKTKCKNIFFLSDKQTQVRGGNYHYLFKIMRLKEIIKKIKPDIINAHYSYSLGFVSLLAKKLSHIDCEFSVVCHGSDILKPPNKFIFDKINRYVLKNSNKIFAVSDQIADKIKTFGVDKKLFVGQYGIDTLSLDNIKVDSKDIDIFSNRTFDSNSRIIFLLDILSSMNIVKNKRVVFILPTVSENDFNNLKTKYKNIEFYKSMEHDKMIGLLKRSKIYISATKSDGTSLSLLEAMYCKCIPIVSNIVSNRSWIVSFLNGYLFNRKEELVIEIENAIVDYDKVYSKVGQLNRNLIKNRADYKIQMSKIESFLFEDSK